MTLYADAGHAFFNDTRPSYVESATAAWRDALAWFNTYRTYRRVGGFPATGDPEPDATEAVTA